MFRVRIALISACLVAAATGLIYLTVTSALEKNVVEWTTGSVMHAQAQLRRSTRLEAVDLTTLTAGFAREDEFNQIFSKGSDQEKKVAALNACDLRRARLDKEGHKVGVIAVVDATGKVIARDRDESFSWHSGEDLGKAFPSLALALGGAANKDVWDLDGAMYRVGAAAIKDPQGKVLGAVFVGDVESATDAKQEAKRSGVQVAWFYQSRGDMKIAASSFATGETGSSSEEKELAGKLFKPGNLVDWEALRTEDEEHAHSFTVKINGEEWVAAAAPIYGNIASSQTRSGFVVLTSMTQARAGVARAGMLILVLGLLSLLAAVGAAVGTARRFLGPLDKIEAGVTEIINGNRDYVFESPSPDFEGLANGLDVMLARLLGRPEPGDEDSSGSVDDEEAVAASGGDPTEK